MARNLHQEGGCRYSCCFADRFAVVVCTGFYGQVQIAESLSSTIASTVVGVMLGYFLKALFETFFEKREERLRSKEGIHEDSVDIEEV